jgi:hypothetical protein
VSEAHGRPGASWARSGGRPASPWWWTVLTGAVLMQLVVLYAPSGPGAVPFPHSDKVVHVGVFLVPVFAALAAGVSPRLVVAVFAGHAVVSEIVRGWVLPTRSGDAWDVVADLVGVALGVGLWGLAARLRPAATSVSGQRRSRW